MRILIVSQYFRPENFRINDLALKLQQRNHKVTVLTGMPNYPEGKIAEGYAKFTTRRDNWEGIEIIRVPLIPRQKSRGWQLALNYLSFMVSACILGPFLLRGRKFDIVFSPSYSPATTNIPAILLKRIKKIPMIMWVQDLWPQSLSATGAVKSEAILNRVAAMMRWIYRHSDLIMIQSPAFKDPILEIADVAEKIEPFPNWAEDIFQPLAQADDSSLPEGFNVMFAGNLGKAQSLETIVEAAWKLRDQPINWIILGDGRQGDWLRAEIKAKDLSHCMHQLGRRPMTDMPSYFSRADAMLVTLSPDPVIATTIPGKIQSYLACGRPVIGALDGEGARVIKDSKSGFAVASGDAGGLATAVLKLAAYSDSERETLGANALTYYKQHFSSETLVSALENNMIKLIRGDT
jgi:glycosyltransferase involved in cell wall biosynthesis